MNIFGHNFRLAIWGESHGPQIGISIDGVPAGIPLSAEDFEADLARRRSGARGTTPRREPDIPQIVSGLYNGMTTGAPLTIEFANTDTHSQDYATVARHYRPSHADLVAYHRFNGFNDPRGGGHQTIQSLYAIGYGGAAGLGLGNSRQKHLFVPEPQNDFIFSILCEELGFLGACAVILLFSALLWRGITLAAYAPDRFGALLVVGFVVQVALQAVLNIAVVTNTIPNTGISLPFFSSGGTSLMMLLGEMGIVLSVSRGES